jgi:beta-xylosidase
MMSEHSTLKLRNAALLFVTLLALAPSVRADALADGNSAVGKEQALLFSFFREPNGEAGLQLASSTNGLQWTEIDPPDGKSFLEPKIGGKLMRDPCIRRGRDGTFHMVWTTSWGQPTVFGYAHSKDLIHWSEQRGIPVLEKNPEAKNVWAPELFYDDIKGEWLIFWATTIPGKFSETENSGDFNHRIYYVTTKDFETFSPTKLLYDGGFNVIDATILSAKGKYYLVVKDETKNPVHKTLHLAVADAAQGPYGKVGPAITGDWVEGPSAIQLGTEFYIYFDHYTRPQYYGAVKSIDLERWQDISSQVSFPRAARHGTVLQVPESVIRNLQNQEHNQQPKP